MSLSYCAVRCNRSAEIVGCYLGYLWLPGTGMLAAAACIASIAAFVWLLRCIRTLRARHAAYGGIYIANAVLWLWAIDGVRPTSGTFWVSPGPCRMAIITLDLGLG